MDNCKNHWHFEFSTDEDGPGDVGSSCPDCGCVMMPGGEASAEFFAEHQRRIKRMICLRACYLGRDLIFTCDRPASPTALAGGACLCEEHNQ